MPKRRERTQLTVQIPDPALLARLRTLAERRRQTITTVVIEALEALLAAPAAPTPGAADPELARRVEALERRVHALEQSPAPVPRAPAPAPPMERTTPEGAITTAELARLTGTNHKAWNNWAASRSAGEVRVHPDAGAWRLVGRVLSDAGGPARCVWEPAESSRGQR